MKCRVYLRISHSHVLGHPHEGSSYPSQKVLQTAWHRLEHAKSRISELDNHRQRLGADLARNTTASSSIQKPGLTLLQGSHSLKLYDDYTL